MVQSFILSIIKHHVSSILFSVVYSLICAPSHNFGQTIETNWGIHTFSGHKLTKSHQVLHVFWAFFKADRESLGHPDAPLEATLRCGGADARTGDT